MLYEVQKLYWLKSEINPIFWTNFFDYFWNESFLINELVLCDIFYYLLKQQLHAEKYKFVWNPKFFSQFLNLNYLIDSNIMLYKRLAIHCLTIPLWNHIFVLSSDTSSHWYLQFLRLCNFVIIVQKLILSGLISHNPFLQNLVSVLLNSIFNLFLKTFFQFQFLLQLLTGW
jgi:hypothetical protein